MCRSLPHSGSTNDAFLQGAFGYVVDAIVVVVVVVVAAAAAAAAAAVFVVVLVLLFLCFYDTLP